jgi:hypothetical protein
VQCRPPACHCTLHGRARVAQAGRSFRWIGGRERGRVGGGGFGARANLMAGTSATATTATAAATTTATTKKTGSWSSDAGPPAPAQFGAPLYMPSGPHARARAPQALLSLSFISDKVLLFPLQVSDIRNQIYHISAGSRGSEAIFRDPTGGKGCGPRNRGRWWHGNEAVLLFL